MYAIQFTQHLIALNNLLRLQIHGTLLIIFMAFQIKFDETRFLCLKKKTIAIFLWLWIEVKSLRDFYSDLHFYFTSNFIVFDRFKKVKACANIIWHFKHTYQNKVTQIVSLDWENLSRNWNASSWESLNKTKKQHRTTNQIAKKWTGAKMVEPCNIG